MALNINPVTRAEFDRQTKFLTVTLRDTLAEFVKKKAWLDDETGGTDAYLGVLGYNVDEIAALRAGYGSGVKLGQISHGQATQAQADDFFFWLKHFVGID